jgi:predicted O-methyltransferase YrrM
MFFDRRRTSMNYLPELPGIPEGLRAGRSPRDGYARGWGLEFGGLADHVRKDPLYQEAFALVAGRSIVSEARRMNLFLLLRFYLPGLAPGHIIEFGAYKGGNAAFMAHVAAKTVPGTQVYALDTYAGMPATDKTVDAHSAGDFGDNRFEDVRAYVAKTGLANLHLVRGTFEETAAQLVREKGPFTLAHIDCDIHSAVVHAYETVKPAMVPGGYLVFDDATVSSCIGATEAVESLVVRRDGLNSEQVFPHFVFRAGL